MKTFFAKLHQRIFLFLYRNAHAADDLRESVKALTEAARSVESAVLNQQKVLVEIRDHAKFLASAEKASLQRAGHKHDF